MGNATFRWEAQRLPWNKRRVAFMQLVQINSEIIKTIVKGKMMHETLLYRTLKVKNVSALHTMLLKMKIENEHGVWPQTELHLGGVPHTALQCINEDGRH